MLYHLNDLSRETHWLIRASMTAFTVGFAAGLLALLVSLIGCTPGCPKESPPKKIKAFGNDVYYFEYTGKTFADELAEFIGSHAKWHLVSIAPDINGGGDTKGYIVVFDKLRPELGPPPCPPAKELTDEEIFKAVQRQLEKQTDELLEQMERRRFNLLKPPLAPLQPEKNL